MEAQETSDADVKLTIPSEAEMGRNQCDAKTRPKLKRAGPTGFSRAVGFIKGFLPNREGGGIVLQGMLKCWTGDRPSE